MRRLLGLTAMYAAIAQMHPLIERRTVAIKQPEPEWKRKKCKSCKNCGSYCFPYDYNGTEFYKYSKSNFNACKMYSKK